MSIVPSGVPGKGTQLSSNLEKPVTSNLDPIEQFGERMGVKTSKVSTPSDFKTRRLRLDDLKSPAKSLVKKPSIKSPIRKLGRIEIKPELARTRQQSIASVLTPRGILKSPSFSSEKVRSPKASVRIKSARKGNPLRGEKTATGKEPKPTTNASTSDDTTDSGLRDEEQARRKGRARARWRRLRLAISAGLRAGPSLVQLARAGEQHSGSGVAGLAASLQATAPSSHLC